MKDGYGIPYIPLSRLREIWSIAKDIYFGRNSYNERDLFHLLVRQEVDRIMVQYYQTQLEHARTYIGIEGYTCPLCTYENGKFIKNCSMHQQIKELEKENGEIYLILANLTENSVNIVNELTANNKKLEKKLEEVAGILLFGIADAVEKMALEDTTVEDHRYDD